MYCISQFINNVWKSLPGRMNVKIPAGDQTCADVSRRHEHVSQCHRFARNVCKSKCVLEIFCECIQSLMCLVLKAFLFVLRLFEVMPTDFAGPLTFPVFMLLSEFTKCHMGLESFCRRHIALCFVSVYFWALMNYLTVQRDLLILPRDAEQLTSK